MLNPVKQQQYERHGSHLFKYQVDWIGIEHNNGIYFHIR